jgi:hypothetical protein
MIIKCAWCGHIIDDSIEGPISHGICPSCKNLLLNNRAEIDDETSNLDDDKGDMSRNNDYIEEKE